ncbi:MAG TPA: hypothetical protein VMF52_13050 [Steroidobacteraceae bacterium]|nr:hypothetical protein [Steroidobacteraceae bacterium]
MQNRIVSRALRDLALPLLLPLLSATLLAGCSNANNPYAKIADGPLTTGSLHTVTYVTEDPKFAEGLGKGAYDTLALAPNYQNAIKVESVLWDVPEEVAGKVVILKAPPGAPDIRVLLLPALPPAPPAADADALRDFYRNVLGTDVPRAPGNLSAPGVRVQVWTYLVPDILDVKRKLRAHTIPLLTEPVGITTSYLGNEQAMSLRAPDGAIVELVQTALQ